MVFFVFFSELHFGVLLKLNILAGVVFLKLDSQQFRIYCIYCI